MGNRNSEFTMNSASPPTGTLIKLQVDESPGLLHTFTGRCGPAPLIGKPSSESAPPVKKRSLNGTALPEKGTATPKRRLFAHVSQGLTGM